MSAHLLYIQLKLFKAGLCCEQMDRVLTIRISDFIQNHALVVFQNHSVAVHKVSQERY
jgi:hypothetical protein